jgi:hypothetical protein
MTIRRERPSTDPRRWVDDSGIVRSDIRSSFGSSTTTAEGVPLTIKLTVRDAVSGDAA